MLGNTRRSVSLMKEKRWDESEEDSTKSAPTAIFTFNLSGKYAGTSTYNKINHIFTGVFIKIAAI